MLLVKILSRQNKYLARKVRKIICSSYFKTIPVNYFGKLNNVEIFINPSPSDIKSISETTGGLYVRFIADSKHHKIYIWNGNLALHAPTAAKLGLENKIIDLYAKYLCGDARIRGYRLILEDTYGPPRQLNDLKWDWLKTYIHIN